MNEKLRQSLKFYRFINLAEIYGSPILKTRGKPPTWLPRERLVELSKYRNNKQESTGEHRRTPENTGEHRRARESTGEHRRALE